jgi:CubicO group peptidase (beta-lactamase class C family)
MAEASAELLDGAGPAIRGVLREHDVPGAVVAVAVADGPIAAVAFGTDGRGDRLAADALFPVASVAKLGLALAVLRLADAGLLTPDDPLARHLPDAAAARSGVTLRHLFAHTSGLPTASGGGPVESWAEIAAADLAAAPERPVGHRVVYTAVGYNLLALVAERLTGRSIQALYRDTVLGPLGVEGYLGTAPVRPVTPLAGDAAPRDRSHGWPTRDLITTAAGSLALARAFAGVPSGFLRPESRTAATRDQTDGAGGGMSSLQYARSPWGLGPELPGDKQPHWAPVAASPRSFGHAGAGGRVAWMDPDAGVGWAVITSRLIATPPEIAAVLAPIGAAILAQAGRR